MTDPALRRWVGVYLTSEVVTTLDLVQGGEVAEYIESVLTRFGNHAIGDMLERLATSATDRLPLFVLPVALEPHDAECGPIGPWACVPWWAAAVRAAANDGTPCAIRSRSRSLDEARTRRPSWKPCQPSGRGRTWLRPISTRAESCSKTASTLHLVTSAHSSVLTVATAGSTLLYPNSVIAPTMTRLLGPSPCLLLPRRPDHAETPVSLRTKLRGIGNHGFRISTCGRFMWLPNKLANLCVLIARRPGSELVCVVHVRWTAGRLRRKEQRRLM